MRTRSYFAWRVVALLPAAALAFAACDRSAGPQHGGPGIAGPVFGVGSGLGAPQDSTGGGSGYRYQYRGASDYANLSFTLSGDSMAGGYTGGYLGVALSSDGSGSASLSYYIQTCDANWYCDIVEEGYGPIPARDVRVTRHGVELNTNTATNPDFYYYVGSGGPIVVSWAGSGTYATQSTTTQRTQSGEMRIRIRSTSEWYDAIASGTIVTWSVAGSWGQVGHASNYEFDVEK